MKSSVTTQRTRTWRHILRHLRPHMPLLVLSLLCALGTVVLTLYVPLLFGRVIDQMVLGATDFSAIGALFLEIGAWVLLTALLRFLMESVNRRITYRTVRDVRCGAFARMERLPLSYMDRHPTGDTVSRIINDTDTFAEGLLLGFSQMFTGILTIVGTLVFMLSIQPIIALIVVALTPLSLFIARFIAMRTHHLFRRQAQTQGEQTACIDEMLGQIKTVKAFGHEDEAVASFREVNDRLAACSLKATFFSSLVNPTTRFVNSVIYAVVALVGALFAIGSPATAPFTVGSLTALLSYVNQYTKPFNEISGVIAEFQNSLSCADRIFELLDEPTEQEAAQPLEDEPTVEGQVELCNVSFSYTPDKPLIEHLSLRVAAGEHIAIVGPTGCGKTTLINLLMRFYDVTDGTILVDGTDIRTVHRSTLRRPYGMVLQDTWLKRASVMDNLRFGCPDATEDEVIAAARLVHAHGFITRLPSGYDTVLEEGGGNLSSGQKQLLCIARTLLSRPRMLILDEATSSIDTRTEAHISEAFHLMMKGKTSFLVAHRLSTVMNADAILVMKDGHIVEIGTHKQLLQRGGFYKHLYDSQFAVAPTVTVENNSIL